MEWNSAVFKIRKPVLVHEQRVLGLGISRKCFKMTLSTSPGHSELLYTMSVGLLTEADSFRQVLFHLAFSISIKISSTEALKLLALHLADSRQLNFPVCLN